MLIRHEGSVRETQKRLKSKSKINNWIWKVNQRRISRFSINKTGLGPLERTSSSSSTRFNWMQFNWAKQKENWFTINTDKRRTFMENGKSSREFFPPEFHTRRTRAHVSRANKKRWNFGKMSRHTTEKLHAVLNNKANKNNLNCTPTIWYLRGVDGERNMLSALLWNAKKVIFSTPSDFNFNSSCRRRHKS